MKLFRKSGPDRCWICSSIRDLTGEHKFKASDLRRHFPGETMVVGRPNERRKVAHGPNSVHLKYESRICGTCNSSTTQASDRAYDALIRTIEAGGSNGVAIDNASPASSKSPPEIPGGHLWRPPSVFATEPVSAWWTTGPPPIGYVRTGHAIPWLHPPTDGVRPARDNTVPRGRVLRPPARRGRHRAASSSLTGSICQSGAQSPSRIHRLSPGNNAPVRP
jgi:hypothetical protein